MPTASRQVTRNTGSDGSSSTGSQKSQQKQTGSSHKADSGESRREQSESRSSSQARSGKSTSKRDGTSHSTSARKQVSTKLGKNAQTSSETVLAEKPQTTRVTREIGGGTAQASTEDFAFSISFEVEVSGQICDDC
jgi:hypothetical protein